MKLLSCHASSIKSPHPSSWHHMSIDSDVIVLTDQLTLIHFRTNRHASINQLPSPYLSSQLHNWKDISNFGPVKLVEKDNVLWHKSTNNTLFSIPGNCANLSCTLKSVWHWPINLVHLKRISSDPWCIQTNLHYWREHWHCHGHWHWK